MDKKIENDIPLKKYYKKTFENIDEEKRERVRQAAISEFAQKGFISANINNIAKTAKISIGSIYNYFDSKEKLFLYIIEHAFKVLEKAIGDIDLEEGDIFEKFENLLKAAVKYSKAYPGLNQIYLDMTSEGLSHLSGQLSQKMETISSQFYTKLLSNAIDEGTVDPTIDKKIVSFCIDNLILILQYSYTSAYFKERLKIFTGEEYFKNDDLIIEGIMKFLRNALEKRE